MITINEILALKGEKINTGVLSGKGFRGVSIDSRTVNGSELFFAIKGGSNDGHNYVSDLVKKKIIKAAVVNKKWYDRSGKSLKGCSFVAVKDTIKTLGELAVIHRDLMNIPIAAIAGSNGKTTTKDLAAAVLSKKFNLLKTEGNFNNHIGLPLTLLRIEEKHDFCVLETGSNHFNELEYLCRIAKPDAALVTNIGREHLEFFKNLNGVAKEEFQVYDWVRKNGSVCFYDLNDDYIRKYKKNKKEDSFTYSYNYSADVKGTMCGYDKMFRPVISYKYNGKTYKTYVNTFGKHSFYNGLAAIALGVYFGVRAADIAEALQNFNSHSGKRMQVETKDGIVLINDAYNSNPDSVKLGFETLKEYKTKGRKHVILADMLEMGKASEKEHLNIGKAAAQMKFDFLYTYGKDSFQTFKGAKNLKNNFYFNIKDDMAEFVKSNIRKGDIVYVKGSRGMKLEEVIQKIFIN
ncbi:MAG: UDP-N-acetylmuramoyl-tripeptide--D-alanyl-D-alanine ligase [Ignavibacteria bacterium]|nr:UDP-N-acetylmuramoyl-tripeptide--D-alanyl-D-alanine ligase [Ignavibacteria bacterium]